MNEEDRRDRFTWDVGNIKFLDDDEDKENTAQRAETADIARLGSMQSWDLDINTIDALRAFLRSSNITPAHFMQLPVYQRNVEAMPWLKDLAKYADEK